MKEFRAVVVGCGRVGSRFSEDSLQKGVYSHAEAFSLNPRIELVGLCDSNQQELERATAKWDKPGFVDLSVALRETQPELLSVCTPDNTHLEIVECATKHSPIRAIVLEKPLAGNLTDGERIIELARKSGQILAVNYSRRFSPAFQFLRRGIQEQLWGSLVLARFVYGKGLLHNGSHALDLLRFLFGDIEELSWRSKVIRDQGQPAGDVEVRVSSKGRAVLQHVPESVATIFEGDFLFERKRWQFELGGETWREFNQKAALYSNYTNFVSSTTLPAEFKEPLGSCLPNLIDNLIEHLDGDEPLLCSGEDGLAVMRAIETLSVK